MSKVNLTINGIDVSVEKGTTVLEAAQAEGIYIPTLCYLKEINDVAACRMCVAEFERMGLKPTCTLEANEGMKVETESEKVVASRRQTLELLASYHSFECWTCARENTCHFYDMMEYYNVDDVFKHEYDLPAKERVMNVSSAITLDTGKCVHCSSCVAVCEKIVTPGTLDFVDRGFDTIIAPTNVGSTLDDIACISCGQCVKVCPTAAITETSHSKQVKSAIRDRNKHVVVQVDPAVSAAIGEMFEYPMGTSITEMEGKLYNAINQLGFDEITDTNFATDLTVMETSTDFIGRLQKQLNNEVAHLPMFTSTNAGWIRYVEQYNPEYLDNLSKAKSPHMMQGAFIKNVYAKEVLKKDPSNVYVVSVLPGTAEKYEIERPEMEVDGVRDVDAVLTTRELAIMIKDANIDFRNLEAYKPASELATFTGFGKQVNLLDGILESSLRTVSANLDNKELPAVTFAPVNGRDDIQEASLTLAGVEINVLSVFGGKAMKELFNILEGDKQYHFVEIYDNLGAALNGGGQPIQREEYMEGLDVLSLRKQALETMDAEQRVAHNNQTVKVAYDKYLERPGSGFAQKLFHTTYRNESYKLK